MLPSRSSHCWPPRGQQAYLNRYYNLDESAVDTAARARPSYTSAMRQPNDAGLRVTDTVTSTAYGTGLPRGARLPPRTACAAAAA